MAYGIHAEPLGESCSTAAASLYSLGLVSRRARLPLALASGGLWQRRHVCRAMIGIRPRRAESCQAELRDNFFPTRSEQPCVGDAELS